MVLVRFASNGRARLGVVQADEVVDLSLVMDRAPTDISALLRLELDDPVAAATQAASDAPASARFDYSSIKLLPPAISFGKAICLGRNYVSHVEELNNAVPDYPIVFLRGASSFVGHDGPIVRPKVSDQLDYEGELVAFVGKRGRHVSTQDALSLISGYSVFNDATIRDYQRRTAQWTMGKNFDSTGGFGPAFIPASALPPGAAGLRIETRLNGEVVQEADTGDMVFSVAETVRLMSEAMTLEPGDLLIMGTPGGVGAARNPPLYMKPGDVCEVEIEQIGLLRNPIVQEV